MPSDPGWDLSLARMTESRHGAVFLDEHDLCLKDVRVFGKRLIQHAPKELLTLLQLSLGERRALGLHALENRAQIVWKRLLVSRGRVEKQALPPDVGTQLEQPQSPGSKLVEMLDVRLGGANCLGLSRAADQANAEDEPPHTAAHASTVVDADRMPN